MALNFQESIPLAPLTTLGIGGPARLFLEASTEELVLEGCRHARRHRLPLLILGGGSNLVVADVGFPGVVIRMAIAGREELTPPDANSNERIFRVGAGIVWDDFVDYCVNENLAGVECLSGIPGSVGATPVQNVGAYGQEVSRVIRSVRVYDGQDDRVCELQNSDCGFSYRRSLFNSVARRRYVVLAVTFALRVGGAPTLSYAEVARQFEGSKSAPALSSVRQAVLGIRRAKAMLLVPDDPDCRSVGSFFKNPVVSESFFRGLPQEFAAASIPHYPVTDSLSSASEAARVKLPAAWLIEQAGFHKGYPRDTTGAHRVGISTKHTLALVNRGGATAREVLALMREIQIGVQERFHLHLEPEPEFVGFEEGAPAERI